LIDGCQLQNQPFYSFERKENFKLMFACLLFCIISNI
jgi:hypothetical protein